MGQVLKTYLGLFFLLLMGLVGIGVVAGGQGSPGPPAFSVAGWRGGA